MRLIDQPYILTKEQIHFYHENKFIKLKNVFDEETLAHYGQLIKDKVKELNTQHIPIEERDTYSKAFLQIFNLWRESEDVKEFIFGKRLAGIATQLMGTEGVRMYHDQALFKEPGGGFTPWHADQYYWPLANDNTITAWIPLQAVPLEMGPLEFSAKSHTLQDGRNLKISDDSEQVIGQKLRLGDFEKVVEPFDLGEVSFHSGWVFHRAGANTTEEMRAVMTVIYMDKNMKLKNPENDNQQLDWDTWCPGAKIGEVIDTEINPVIF
ncbi:phytanoyl-CoA dioxygenase family protein [Jiulongibacter sediminis]|jgi:ectoine hydroxylase-related dioxygenase (phytanoyl-CoA dioxygenase family)|uniref:phytanoyl-CoA dioxygenase family protein n=1 Tax=Jiulongibacter sediminis TaxID=1605367 RepID=UPI0026EF1EFE|nr:phytanoyl-CoA dioxygenase family protein [Jiulongibacter sediminis]